MPNRARPIAIIAEAATFGGLPPGFPTVLAANMATRIRHPLGDPFGLTVSGVNLTRLPPRA